MSPIAPTSTEKSWMEKNMASPEEKQAYEEYVNHVKEPINEEWEPLVNYSPEDKEYYKLLDLIEMSEDMNASEDSNNCHQLLSEQTWEDRPARNCSQDTMSRRSEIIVPAKITIAGEGYATAECPYGKIFIPNYLLNWKVGKWGGSEYLGMNTMKIQFKGFEGCRNTSMPWRAIELEKVE